MKVAEGFDGLLGWCHFMFQSSLFIGQMICCLFFLFVVKNTSLGFIFLTYVATKRNNVATSLYSVQVNQGRDIVNYVTTYFLAE